MDKKEKCKALMLKFFGPASASLVDYMPEEGCIDECRKKVEAMLGPEKAKEFDKI